MSKTEDDTFNALRRLPYEQMRDMFVNKFFHWTEEELAHLVESCGWVYSEFYDRYIQELSESAAKLYRSEGKTTEEYWNQ